MADTTQGRPQGFNPAFLSALFPILVIWVRDLNSQGMDYQ